MTRVKLKGRRYLRPDKRTIIVPISGGKDSQLVLQQALERYSDHLIVCVHQNTGFDHPDTYEHIKYIERFYGVVVHHTHSKLYPTGMIEFIRAVKYFPNNVARGCTSRLKQRPFGEWLRVNKYTRPGAALVLMGMRSDESRARNDKFGEMDPEEEWTLPDISREYARKTYGNIAVKLPIVNYTTAEVFGELRGLVNPLYARGHIRVGCYPCLLANNQEWRAAVRDGVGRMHVEELLQIEKEFKRTKNPRKFIKVHPTRDVRALLLDADAELSATSDSECGWCSI